MKKQKAFMVFATALIFLAFNSCKSHNPAAIMPIQTPQQVQAAIVQEPPAEGDNDFTFALYHQINSSNNNVFFSPFSIYTALSMTYEGAKGETALEMAKVLYLQQDNTTRWQAFASLITEINNPNKHYYMLSTANNLWLEQNYPFLPSFLNTVETYYSASATAMDFVNNASACLNTINTAVANETAGKITNLLPSGSIGPTTALVLTNAIYFEATWVSQFDVNSTTYNAFTTSSGQVEQVQTMHQTLASNVENYYGVASAMELPYLDKEVSMFIFLPPAGAAGMASLDNYMTGDKMNSWLAARPATVTSTSDVAVSLPKFTVNTSYGLVNTLSAMGMPTPFSPVKADFTGMSSLGNLYISGVFHKAYVSVAEYGTEAAAATGVVVTGNGIIPVQYYFTVNSPFIFMIRENTSNTILFMGKVNDPNAG